MNVRIAKLSDYEELMTLYNLFVGDDRYSKHDNDSFKKVLENHRCFIFVAEDERKLAGFVSFSVRDVIRYPKPIAELDELFIKEENRKHGLGKMLMEIVERKAKELNCYRMFIESSFKHEAAHKFYESLGYTNYGYHFIKNL